MTDEQDRAAIECCKELLRSLMAKRGIDAYVSAIAPIVPTGYDPFAMRCPHGVSWFMQPTAAQLAKWQKEGTA